MNLMNVIKHAEAKQTEAKLHYRLLDIYEGNLIQYVKQAISTELSADSYKIASQRIPSINVLEKVTDKLTRVYNDVPQRTLPDAKDQEVINAYASSIDIQNAMSSAELLLNLNKAFALEPYLNDEGLFSVRVLGAHEFTVYSDDTVEPTKPTAFIKYMGAVTKGKKTLSRFWIYTADTFVDCDSEGTISEQRENPYGVLPMIYCNASSFRLSPSPDLDSFDNTILIPKLLTDLNFAAQFQSHSIMYGIDVDATKLQGGPDAFWSLKSQEGSDKKPTIGVLSPTVDVDKVLSLIKFTVSSWLDSKGIKPGSGNVANSSPESAVSKLVDEADASQIVQANRILLAKTEQKLWHLIGIMHNEFINSEKLKFNQGLTTPLQVSISFPTQKPIQDPNEKRTDLEFKLKNKLISYDRALKQANPDLTNDEIEKLKQEIKNENQ